MAEFDFWSALFGPQGALALAATAAVVLWRRHVKDDDDRAKVRDLNLEYERSRTRAAEERLEHLGGIMKAATDVMEKSVSTTERVVDVLNSRRGSGRRHEDPDGA